MGKLSCSTDAGQNRWGSSGNCLQSRVEEGEGLLVEVEPDLEVLRFLEWTLAPDGLRQIWAWNWVNRLRCHRRTHHRAGVFDDRGVSFRVEEGAQAEVSEVVVKVDLLS